MNETRFSFGFRTKIVKENQEFHFIGLMVSFGLFGCQSNFIRRINFRMV